MNSTHSALDIGIGTGLLELRLQFYHKGDVDLLFFFNFKSHFIVIMNRNKKENRGEELWEP